jgi:chromosome partitioning protein
MTRVIAVLSQKGGVGKTTTVVNLGTALADNTFKVLLIDLDPTGGMSGWLADGDLSTVSGVDKFLLQGGTVGDVLRRSSSLGLDYIPSGNGLRSISRAESFDAGALSRRMGELKDSYDFILIDCPPSSDSLNAWALMAADSILLPIQTEALPLRSGLRFMGWLTDFKSRNGCRADILGILPCMYDARTRLSKRILEAMRKSDNLGPLVFDTVIRKNARLAELPDSGKSIFKSASTSYGAEDYSSLAREILGRYGISTPAGDDNSAENQAEVSNSQGETPVSEPVEQQSGLND